jgi:hypothetical protein
LSLVRLEEQESVLPPAPEEAGILGFPGHRRPGTSGRNSGGNTGRIPGQGARFPWGFMELSPPLTRQENPRPAGCRKVRSRGVYSSVTGRREPFTAGNIVSVGEQAFD